ncbi:glutamate--cysteine ligase [Arthrobacter sp. JSM 101049]|uniref:glutamate--cysteine ligase n=1 Tax=Arthrobacter sp. JSM 101049 TaxID=929097 RepID=UPI00356A5167
MGAEVSKKTFTRAQRTTYRERLNQNLEAFEAFLAEGHFASSGTIGLELELNLANGDFTPAMRNAAVLESIADEAFQTEIGAFNIELNHPALQVAGRGLRELEESLRDQLNRADARADEAGVDLLMTGILPTLRREQLQDEQWMSAGKRYAALNTSVLQARGEDVLIDISGREHLRFYAPTIAPEAACTSVQLHVQLSPDEFAPAWNAAQIIAGPQLALAANSPVFLEKVLWHETRIELFQQSIDTRAPEMRAQGVRPRVWFGERWITSIFDLFEENVRYFPALLPELAKRGPEKTRAGAPQLHELRLHNGTVYRWNRPIYDPGRELPHLRLENRLLPGGPSVLDTVANAAFFFGLVRRLRTAQRPLWSRMAFGTAAENFMACARNGLHATVYWPGVGEIPVSELIVRHLLPLAAEGLADVGVDDAVAARYLDVLRERAGTEQNGALWQIAALDRLESHGLDRRHALQEMTRLYWEHMHRSGPVHEWPLP